MRAYSMDLRVGVLADCDHRRDGPAAGRRPRRWAADPEATLAEVTARLGLAVNLTTLWRAVAALGLTVKVVRLAEHDRPDVAPLACSP